MSTITEGYISSVVGEVASNCNLKEWQHSVSHFDSIGQNYFGIIIPVTLTGCSDDEKVTQVIRVVLKLAPTDERFRVSGAVTLLFLREIFVYSKLLERYRELQKNLPVNCQLVIPRLYYTNNEYCNEVIAMEDMTSDGYRPFVSEKFLDLQHVTVALKCLAKFHALSFILKERDPELYDEMTNVCVPLSERSNKRYFEVMLDRLTKAISKLEDTQHVPLLEKLKKNCGKYYEIDLVHGKCISHGDVWKENILFKYEEDKPTSCCLIDYQTTRMASPAFDTLFLIISSTDAELRRKHYHQLLDIYYQTFDQTLKESGLNSQLLYSTQTFAKDLKIVAPACFITANTALWLSNGLQEEGHVKSKNVWTTPEEKEKAVITYKSVIVSIIDDFYKYGYLPSEIPL